MNSNSEQNDSTQPTHDRRHMNLGPPAANSFVERRADEIQRNDVRILVEERRLEEAVNRARLEDLAIKDARQNRMLTWMAVIIAFLALIYPVYKDGKAEKSAEDILKTLGTSGEQLRQDLIKAQNDHLMYEKALKELQFDGTKVLNRLDNIDKQLTETADGLKEVQKDINILNSDILKQSSQIEIIRERIRTRNSDYGSYPQ